MRSHLLPAVVMLLTGTGCPSEFGRDGRIDQAMEDDMRQGADVCPAGQHWERLKRKDCLDSDCGSCVDDNPDGGR